MNLPISWLKQFVNIKSNATEIASKLTLSGSEVEKIVDNSMGLSKIVIGQIKSIEPHPDADNLQIAHVDVGSAIGRANGRRPLLKVADRSRDADHSRCLLEIVCGAKNIKPMQKVPVAMLGGSVPGISIEARKIRGIASQGMMCSQRELGIGDDHSGIFILPEDAKIGTDVVKYLELDDPVLELDITPNRPDCFSIRGLAREVGALYGKRPSLNLPLSKGGEVRESGTPASSSVSVKIEDKKLCPKYCARVIQGVDVKESPLWLQSKLLQVNIRPINNIVDVTNYVMMELGHPMHAFDANLVNGKIIIIRKAKATEKILALDEQKYTLNPDMLVIADSKKPIAIAGIMGGQETAVTDATNNIILESAIFDQKSIRKTSKALGLRSESSSRFEKGIDAQVVEEAIDRAAALIHELAGGTILKGIVTAGEVKNQELTISLSINQVERILGVSVTSAKAKSILTCLGFEASEGTPLKSRLSKGGKIIVKVPSWRMHDIKIPEDLIEEIGRMIDYNTMPKTLPQADLVSPRMEHLHKLRHNLRHYLAGIGYSELLTYSFYNEKLLEFSGIPKSHHIKLTNPVNDEYPFLRASLKPWMLDKLSQNSALLSRDEFRLFEIGKIFNKDQENWQACIGIIDTKETDEQLYRELRGVVESFFGAKLSVEKNSKTYCLLSGKQEIARINIYPKNSVSLLRFRSCCAIAIINLEFIQKSAKNEKVIFKPISYYPCVERDLSIISQNMVQYTEIESVIKKFNLLIKNVELFDVYPGSNQKNASLTMRLTFSSTDRTLESIEVDQIMEKLCLTLEKKFKINFK